MDKKIYIIKMMIDFLENGKEGEGITIKRGDDHLIVIKHPQEQRFDIP